MPIVLSELCRREEDFLITFGSYMVFLRQFFLLVSYDVFHYFGNKWSESVKLVKRVKSGSHADMIIASFRVCNTSVK